MHDLAADPRKSAVDAALRRHHYRQDALIEVLHTAQQQYGCLPRDVLWYVAEQLQLPPSRVYGVATFYHFFTLEPPGAHTAVVCQGTACYLHGAPQIAAALRAAFAIDDGDTTPDGRLSLASARCLGMSALAPVVVVDGQVIPRATPREIVPQVRAVLSNAGASAPRTATGIGRWAQVTGVTGAADLGGTGDGESHGGAVE
jgi:bidirectional [NiFe] hydrogenase diaphorase subunit